AFKREYRAAFRHLVADFDPEIDHLARDGRRHIHRRLFRFERDERVFRLDGIAGLDEHFDDGNVLEVADIRDFDFDRAHDGCPIVLVLPYLARLQRAEFSYSMTRRISARSDAR